MGSQLIGHQTHISSLLSSTTLLLPHTSLSASMSGNHSQNLPASTSKNRHRGSPHPSGRAGSELPGGGHAQPAPTPSKKKKHKSSTLTLGDGEGWDDESLGGGAAAAGRKGSPAPSALAAGTGGAVGSKKKSSKEKGVGGASKKKRCVQVCVLLRATQVTHVPYFCPCALCVLSSRDSPADSIGTAAGMGMDVDQVVGRPSPGLSQHAAGAIDQEVMVPSKSSKNGGGGSAGGKNGGHPPSSAGLSASGGGGGGSKKKDASTSSSGVANAAGSGGAAAGAATSKSASSSSAAKKAAGSSSNSSTAGGGGSSKKGQQRGASGESLALIEEFGEDVVDPDAEVYCYCRRGGYGAMIGCDADDCAIAWVSQGLPLAPLPTLID